MAANQYDHPPCSTMEPGFFRQADLSVYFVISHTYFPDQSGECHSHGLGFIPVAFYCTPARILLPRYLLCRSFWEKII